jgi:two-component system alkaline phosphatase synthesis response regulator PhoP
MRSKKVLVVDDEKKICDLLEAYLKKDGYEVVTAYEGRQALEIIKKQNPDLVVLDLNLPEMDGLDVCKTLRGWSKIPVIMLTARDEETDKIIGLELGADDYVTKPFSPREIVARVKAVLRRLEEGSNPMIILKSVISCSIQLSMKLNTQGNCCS